MNFGAVERLVVVMVGLYLDRIVLGMYDDYYDDHHDVDDGCCVGCWKHATNLVVWSCDSLSSSYLWRKYLDSLYRWPLDDCYDYQSYYFC